MRKIGILYGMERVFPPALIKRINELGGRDVHAVEIKIGTIRMDELFDYHVIFDRISAHVPYYRTYLKLAVLNGVKVVNNPFVTCAENTLLHIATAHKLGINVPKTVALPSKDVPEGTTGDSLHNLLYPLDWDEAFEYIGWPAYLKPNASNGVSNAFKVYNKQEFFSAYEVTGRKAMVLQENIDWQEYYRCYVLGKEHIRIMNYDPTKPQHLRHKPGEPELEAGLRAKIEEVCLKICSTMDYDFDAIEFAVRGGELWAVSFFNLTPNADPYFLLEDNFNWLLDKTAEYLISLAKMPSRKLKTYGWDELMDIEASEAATKRRAAEKK